jgi:hypothetical protein
VKVEVNGVGWPVAAVEYWIPRPMEVEGGTSQAPFRCFSRLGWCEDDSLNGDAGSGAGLLNDRDRSSLAHDIRSSIIDRALEAEEFRLYVEDDGTFPRVLPREGPGSRAPLAVMNSSYASASSSGTM